MIKQYQPHLPQQYYNDLAWRGLEGTSAYTLLSQTEKDRIQKVNEAEDMQVPQSNPSGVLTYFPLSTPCSN